MPIFELSNKMKKASGKRKFKASLYELKPPECVVNGVGTDFNENGITFLEEFASKTLDSIKDSSVTVEFLDEERTMINAHGITGSKDGLPVFENATVVGHFTNGYIDTVNVKGKDVRCVIGEGYIDEMRYPKFVENLEYALSHGSYIDGSVEISRTDDNEGIVYQYGWKEEGRIPSEYIHTGWAFVLVPADGNSTLLELNSNNKEEVKKMDEKQIMEIVEKAIIETNAVKEDCEKKIAELESAVADKDAKIKDLEDKIASLEAEACGDAEKKKELNEQIAEQNSTISKYQEKEALDKLDKALLAYTEDEAKFAEVEINSYKEKPLECSVDDIISKICIGIVKAQREQEAKLAEINSAKKVEVEDIFCGVQDISDDAEDMNIF